MCVSSVGVLPLRVYDLSMCVCRGAGEYLSQCVSVDTFPFTPWSFEYATFFFRGLVKSVNHDVTFGFWVVWGDVSAGFVP